MKWIYFIKKKSDMGKKVESFIKELIINKNSNPKWLINYNAGENEALKISCNKLNINIKIGNTSPYTPQQNGVVESGFITLWGQERSTMSDMDNKSIRENGLWVECSQTVTYLDVMLLKYKYNCRS